MPLVGLVVARAAASIFLAPAVRDLPCAIPSVVVADLAWLVCVIAVVAATIVAVPAEAIIVVGPVVITALPVFITVPVAVAVTITTTTTIISIRCPLWLVTPPASIIVVPGLLLISVICSIPCTCRVRLRTACGSRLATASHLFQHLAPVLHRDAARRKLPTKQRPRRGHASHQLSIEVSVLDRVSVTSTRPLREVYRCDAHLLLVDSLCCGARHGWVAEVPQQGQGAGTENFFRGVHSAQTSRNAASLVPEEVVR
jgi:hypothetical protein